MFMEMLTMESVNQGFLKVALVKWTFAKVLPVKQPSKKGLFLLSEREEKLRLCLTIADKEISRTIFLRVFLILVYNQLKNLTYPGTCTLKLFTTVTYGF